MKKNKKIEIITKKKIIYLLKPKLIVKHKNINKEIL